MCWEAIYTDTKGNPFKILGTETSDCPVSMVTTQSMELVDLYFRVLEMKEFGVSPYGGDLNKMPSRIVDAFCLLQEESNRVRNLMLSHEKIPQSKRRREK